VSGVPAWTPPNFCKTSSEMLRFLSAGRVVTFLPVIPVRPQSSACLRSHGASNRTPRPCLFSSHAWTAVYPCDDANPRGLHAHGTPTKPHTSYFFKHVGTAKCGYESFFDARPHPLLERMGRYVLDVQHGRDVEAPDERFRRGLQGVDRPLPLS